MATEFKPLLEYKRPVDCWCCSSCETENDQSSPFCRLCGNQKNDRCFTLKKWSASINSIPHRHTTSMSHPRNPAYGNPPAYSRGASTRPDISESYIPASYSSGGSDSSSGNSNWATFWIIAVVIFVVIVICASAS